MRIIIRREIFQVDTFTSLSIYFGQRHIDISIERPKKASDRAFHRKIGR